MSMPFYVSPEQLMKDRADFARKGIGRGRGVVAVQYGDGIVLVSENPRSLHKISEIYDRVAFAAVGRYNEFENLRIAGVRLADMRGYAYDRRDVTGRGLANAYAQTLGTIFSSGGEKPYEVEIFVAEVGDVATADELYRITYDGQMVDEHGFAAMGGDAESVSSYLREHWTEGGTMADALSVAVAALGHGAEGDRQIPAQDLEVAVLDRTRTQPRKFRRLTARTLREVLGPASDAASGAETGTESTGTADDASGAGGGEASHEPQAHDDPADPTDTESSVPPLEDPVTGEPPARRDPALPDDGPDDSPVAPPLDPDDPVG
jgi:proteasome alpha subunit